MLIESRLLMILFPIPEGILHLHSPENLGMYAVLQDAYISIRLIYQGDFSRRQSSEEKLFLCPHSAKSSTKSHNRLILLGLNFRNMLCFSLGKGAFRNSLLQPFKGLDYSQVKTTHYIYCQKEEIRIFGPIFSNRFLPSPKKGLL
jgi:hypothetical protein